MNKATSALSMSDRPFGWRSGGILLLLLLLNFSDLHAMCSTKRRLRQLDAYARTSRESQVMETVRTQLSQRLGQWAEERVRYAVGYAEKDYRIAELQLLAEGNERALVFLEWRRDNTHHFDMVAVERRADGWHFFFSGLPNFTFQDFSPDEAAEQLRRRLVGDGLVNWRGTVRQSYLRDRWFGADRDALHASWLADRV